MKSRHYLWVALYVCCSALFVATDAVAQRVKPTLPEPDTIRSGEYYYLWNEEAQMFMERDWSNSDYDYNYYTALSPITELTFRFVATGSNYYIQKNNGYYFYSSGENLRGSGTSKSNYCIFRLQKQEDGTYTIQRNYSYNAQEFVAPRNNGEGTRLYVNVTDSTYIKWRLIPISSVPINRVGTTASSWNTSGNVVSIDGISMPEKYEETTATLGDVMWQTVAGLENGTYTVELYANARYTPERGFETKATDGQMNCTYLFANNVELSIPVVFNEELNNGLSYTLENVEVTDGTLKMGMTKKADGSNWHTIQIKALTPNFEYASSDNDLQVARMGLYLELEQLDASFYTEPYDKILANSTSAEELIKAAKEVNNMQSTTNAYLQRDWSDYKIQFINDEKWTYHSENLGGTTAYRFEMPNNMYVDKTSLKAIVNVDVDEAVLAYDAFTYTYHDYDNNLTYNDLSYDTYYDRISRHNELNVYIDGELVRNVKRDQIPNRYADYVYPYDIDGQFFEKLTKGAHIIEWEYLRNDYKYDNYYAYNNSYICNVGVVKTPTEISVSLLEPGSLGTEILAQVNSVLEVRKLKIKGEMNAEDWKTIDLITDLFSLDLSEAVITEIPDNQFENHPWLYQLKLPEGLTRIGNHAFYNSCVEDIKFPSTLTTIGKSAFQNSHLRDFQAAHTQLQNIGQFGFANCRYLKNVMLPTESMDNIGSHAFANNRHIENVSLSKDMTSIDFCAFYECQRMRSLVLPEHLDEMGTHTFYNMDSLRGKIVFPAGMTYVPDYGFKYCQSIDSLIISNSVTSIGIGAFDLCTSIKYVNLPDSLLTIADYGLASLNSLRQIEFPQTLQSIGLGGLCWSGLDSVVIPENTTLAEGAFDNGLSLKYAELPTSYYNITNKNIFTNCGNLNRIKIKSPTLLHGYTGEFVTNKGDITLVVPDYLVSSYKLDSYWYTYKDVEGFGTSEVDTWTINNPVTLGATSRFQGSPNIILKNTTLTVNGETGMELNNFNMRLSTNSGEYYSSGYKYYYNRYSSSSQLLSSADISVNGELTMDYYTYANKWAYIALPFDIRVGDIRTDAQYAIRYYDGANRAANQSASGNWKNYGADDIIPAGTGFVYQTSKNVWNTFVAYDNTNKNRALAAKDLSTPLDANACETSAHRGWNLVGNPWMTYFNIHAVDFTAPITVYDQYYSKYQAYSIIDDNVALHPTQAFFVQCPDDIEHITFPARGRQLTSTVTDQNGARSVSPRRLVDVQLCMGEVHDQTRVVMNDRATLGYDYGSDAGKFFAEEEVIQLYTTDTEGTSYAINERPTDDCIVPLAYMAPTAGEYTLKLARNQAGNVVLKDLLLDTETPLTEEGYTFTTDSGTFADRFQLLFTSIGAMGIEGLQVMPEVNATDGGIQAKGRVQVYTTDGRLVAEGEGFLPLQKGFYVVRAQGESKKVVIK